MSTQAVNTFGTSSESPVPDPLDLARKSKRSASVFVAGLIVLTAVLFALCHRGVGNSSIANPNPVGPYSEQGAPRPRPPLLGFEYWPQVFEVWSLLSMIGLIIAGLIMTYRRGRWSPILTMVAAAQTLTVLDPIQNWAAYAPYNPNLLHLPEDWPWVRINPTVEPLMSWLGYVYYWLLPAWLVLWIYKKLVNRTNANPKSWAARHPMATLAIMAYPVCFCWDWMIETFLVHSGLLMYDQVYAPLSFWAGHSWQYPLIFNSTMIALSIFLAAAIMYRDDTGRTFPERTAARFRAFRTRPNLGAYLVTLSVMGPMYLLYFVFFFVARTLGIETTPGQPWQYPETKVYDPQGFYRDKGEPGTFTVGNFTGWERHAVRKDGD